jgi:hypothetical protein
MAFFTVCQLEGKVKCVSPTKSALQIYVSDPTVQYMGDQSNLYEKFQPKIWQRLVGYRYEKKPYFQLHQNCFRIRTVCTS